MTNHWTKNNDPQHATTRGQDLICFIGSQLAEPERAYAQKRGILVTGSSSGGRRRFLKYAGAGAVAVVAAGLGYYATRPAPTQTNLYAPTAKLETDPKYIAALEGQAVEMRGELFDKDRDDLEYALLVNNKTVSEGIAHYTEGYANVRYSVEPSELNLGPNEVGLTVSDGEHVVTDGKPLYVDENVAYPTNELAVPIKGIMYDIDIRLYIKDLFRMNRW